MKQRSLIGPAQRWLIKIQDKYDKKQMRLVLLQTELTQLEAGLALARQEADVEIKLESMWLGGKDEIYTNNPDVEEIEDDIDD